METKICKKCGEVKELILFHKNTNTLTKRAGKCKECAKISAREYYHNNLDKVHIYRKKEYKKHRIKLLEKARQWKQKTFNSWRDYLPNVSKCQICGKRLILGSTNKKESIHFDHKKGNEIIKGSPNHWLRRIPRTPETTKLWDSCHFGILCEQCNIRLPSTNRKEFLLQALRYTDL